MYKDISKELGEKVKAKVEKMGSDSFSLSRKKGRWEGRKKGHPRAGERERGLMGGAQRQSPF